MSGEDDGDFPLFLDLPDDALGFVSRVSERLSGYATLTRPTRLARRHKACPYLRTGMVRYNCKGSLGHSRQRGRKKRLSNGDTTEKT